MVEVGKVSTKTAKEYLFAVFLFIMKICFCSFFVHSRHSKYVNSFHFTAFSPFSISYAETYFPNFFFITIIKISFGSFRYAGIHLLKME